MRRVLALVLFFACVVPTVQAEYFRSANVWTAAILSRGHISYSEQAVSISGASVACSTFPITTRTLSVVGGATYIFFMWVPYDTFFDNEGARVSFESIVSSTTASRVIGQCTSVTDLGLYETASVANITSLVSLPTTPTLTATAAHYYRCVGSFTVATAGTFVMQLAAPACSAGIGFGANAHVRLLRVN